MQDMLLAIWHQDFEQLIQLQAVGLLVTCLVVILFLESSFVFLPLPGDSLVLLAGGLVGMGVLGPEVVFLYLPLAAGVGPQAARVVTVSSGAHRMGSVDPDDLFFERRTYRPWQAYGQSKLANLLFTSELARQAELADVPFIAAAAHPGYAGTNLQFAGPSFAQNSVGRLWMKGMNSVLGQSALAGAWPTLYAATRPDVHSGDYIGPDGWLEQRGHPRHVGRSAAAKDMAVAARLWERSEELTGVTYEWPAD